MSTTNDFLEEIRNPFIVKVLNNCTLLQEKRSNEQSREQSNEQSQLYSYQQSVQQSQYQSNQQSQQQSNQPSLQQSQYKARETGRFRSVQRSMGKQDYVLNPEERTITFEQFRGEQFSVDPAYIVYTNQATMQNDDEDVITKLTLRKSSKQISNNQNTTTNKDLQNETKSKILYPRSTNYSKTEDPNKTQSNKTGETRAFFPIFEKDLKQKYDKLIEMRVRDECRKEFQQENDYILQCVEEQNKLLRNLMVKQLQEKYFQLREDKLKKKEAEEQRAMRVKLLNEEKKKLQMEVMKAQLATQHVKQLQKLKQEIHTQQTQIQDFQRFAQEFHIPSTKLDQTTAKKKLPQQISNDLLTKSPKNKHIDSSSSLRTNGPDDDLSDDNSSVSEWNIEKQANHPFNNSFKKHRKRTMTELGGPTFSLNQPQPQLIGAPLSFNPSSLPYQQQQLSSHQYQYPYLQQQKSLNKLNSQNIGLPNQQQSAPISRGKFLSNKMQQFDYYNKQLNDFTSLQNTSQLPPINGGQAYFTPSHYNIYQQPVIDQGHWRAQSLMGQSPYQNQYVMQPNHLNQPYVSTRLRNQHNHSFM